MASYSYFAGVVHRDLKPENLLLSDPSDSAILKIADFGLSAVVFASENITTSTTTSTTTSCTGAAEIVPDVLYPASDVPFIHPDSDSHHLLHSQSPSVESVSMHEHEAALRSKLTTQGAYSAHSCVDSSSRGSTGIHEVSLLSSPHSESRRKLGQEQGQSQGRGQGQGQDQQRRDRTPRTSTSSSGGDSAAETKEREYREELEKERDAVSAPRAITPSPHHHALPHTCHPHHQSRLPSVKEADSPDGRPRTPVRLREVNFVTPTYCTPPSASAAHNKDGSAPDTPGSAIGTPEMLGPPLPSANSRAQQQQQGMSGLSQQFAVYTPGMGHGAPMRRLRSVVGSPHYIAPEIASNG